MADQVSKLSDKEKDVLQKVVGDDLGSPEHNGPAAVANSPHIPRRPHFRKHPVQRPTSNISRANQVPITHKPLPTDEATHTSETATHRTENVVSTTEEVFTTAETVGTTPGRSVAPTPLAMTKLAPTTVLTTKPITTTPPKDEVTAAGTDNDQTEFPLLDV